MSLLKDVKRCLEEISGFLEKNSVIRPVSGNPPQELHLELSYKCDSRCIICNLKHLRKRQKSPDLSLADIKKSIEASMILKNVKYIILSGGEPWLNREICAITEFFLNNYPEANILILSNLMNSDLILSQLKEIKKRAGLERVSLGSSIDGIGRIHDKVRGVAGAFESTLATALMIKRKFPEVSPVFNFTLMPANSGSIYNVYKWSKKTGFNVSYQIAVPKEEVKETVFRWQSTDIKQAEQGVDKIIEDIWQRNKWDRFDAGQLLGNISLLFLLLNFHYILKYAKNPQRYYGNCPCGEKYAMLNPEGDLYFCPVNKEMTAGNIREEKFDDIWTGSRAKKIRDFFNHRLCHCWLSCTSSSMLAENFFRYKRELNDKYAGNNGPLQPGREPNPKPLIRNEKPQKSKSS